MRPNKYFSHLEEKHIKPINKNIHRHRVKINCKTEICDGLIRVLKILAFSKKKNIDNIQKSINNISIYVIVNIYQLTNLFLG